MRTAYVVVFVVCPMWVMHGFSHRCVLSACEVRRSAAAGVVSLRRLRTSHAIAIASRVDVRCSVTDAASDVVSLLYLGDRPPANV